MKMFGSGRIISLARCELACREYSIMANILLVLKSSTCKYLQVLASCFLKVKSLLDKYLLGVERPSTCKYLIPGTG